MGTPSRLKSSNSSRTPVCLFWFRRDLRLHDNAGLYQALRERSNVLPIFIFDLNILSQLKNPRDARLSFIYQQVSVLKKQLHLQESDVIVRFGKPLDVFNEIVRDYFVESIYCNHDYEPYARRRDQEIELFSATNNISFHTFKDQTLFEKDEILTDAGKPYTVFTPYKKKVQKHLNSFYLESYPTEKYFKSFFKIKSETMMSMTEMKFENTELEFPSPEFSLETIKHYEKRRDFPAITNGTTHIGLHLRFGSVSIREMARIARDLSQVWLSELIWRDFFMQILWHFPQVENASFRPQYDEIEWRESPEEFSRWCQGQTGYKLVDAGMRELNQTGYMHNRVRMVVASFLCKHLIIHWKAGERYFAEKLLDYDLAANSGNWQWAAGSGCDAAPYFRIFNPITQAEKFDPDNKYITRWVPEWNTPQYVKPMVEHAFARERCLRTYNQALNKGKR